MAKRLSLSVRIYFEPHLTELVRLVGYDAFPLDEGRSRLRPLVEKYGKDRVNAAADDILDMRNGVLRLSTKARRAAWQLLGPPPAPVSAAVSRVEEGVVPEGR